MGTQVLRTTSAASGRLRFTPSAGAGSAARRIEARVSQGRLPRKVVTVARFQASTRLVRVVGIRRTGSTLRWRAQAAAASYSVVLAGPGGQVTTQTARGARLVLRPALRRARLTVTVYPVSAFDRAGRATTVTLPAVAAKRRTR